MKDRDIYLIKRKLYQKLVALLNNSSSQMNSIMSLSKVDATSSYYERYKEHIQVDPCKIIPHLSFHHEIQYSDILRIVGFVKETLAQYGISVYLRGQSWHHNYTLIPSLFRKSHNMLIQHDREFVINANEKYVLYQGYLDSFYDDKQIQFDQRRQTFLTNVLSLEAIMQHYGLYSRYIDLVDNLPIALYFAQGDNEYGYLTLVGFQNGATVMPGIHENERQRLIDLRETTSYLAVRPHSQHAYAITDLNLINNLPENFNATISSDFSRYTYLIVKIPQIAIRELIGERYNNFFSLNNLLPSREIDTYYDYLINTHTAISRNYFDNIPSQILGRNLEVHFAQRTFPQQLEEFFTSELMEMILHQHY